MPYKIATRPIGQPKNKKQYNLVKRYLLGALEIVNMINHARREIDPDAEIYVANYAILGRISESFDLGYSLPDVKWVTRSKISSAQKNKDQLKWLNPWVISNPKNIDAIMAFFKASKFKKITTASISTSGKSTRIDPVRLLPVTKEQRAMNLFFLQNLRKKLASNYSVDYVGLGDIILHGGAHEQCITETI